MMITISWTVLQQTPSGASQAQCNVMPQTDTCLRFSLWHAIMVAARACRWCSRPSRGSSTASRWTRRPSSSCPSAGSSYGCVVWIPFIPCWKVGMVRLRELFTALRLAASSGIMRSGSRSSTLHASPDWRTTSCKLAKTDPSLCPYPDHGQTLHCEPPRQGYDKGREKFIYQARQSSLAGREFGDGVLNARRVDSATMRRNRSASASSYLPADLGVANLRSGLRPAR